MSFIVIGMISKPIAGIAVIGGSLGVLAYLIFSDKEGLDN
jgi:hypothetical protein